MRKAALFLTIALTGFLPMLSVAADAPPAASAATFSDAQRAEIEGIIKNYLTVEHPEVMAEGLQKMQQRDQENAEAKTKQAVTDSKDKIFNDANSPVGGNPKGDVTVVEFFDYQCGYCKMSEDGVEHLLKDDKGVKFIYKEFPILGPASVDAAKASLASVKQGKYQAFHDALMGKKDHLTDDMIYQVAKDVGLDVEKLKKDMGDASVTDQLAATLKLGQDIGVRGTPMFIVGGNVFPGALQYDQMKQAVADARAAEKK